MGRIEGRALPGEDEQEGEEAGGDGGGGQRAAEPARGGVAGLDQRAELGEVVPRRHPLLDPGDALVQVGRALHP